jgi:4-hydroxy-2-oxoheptanedioate aldolase
MIRNVALEKIRRGEPALGLSTALGSHLVAEMFAHAGVDWIWIDTQHGCWSYDDALRAIQVISPTGTTPIVRPGSNDFFRIGRLLDAGALGIIVPMVNSPEEVQAALFAARYPPVGGRSTGGVRISLYGADYVQAANDNVLVAVMIETRQAVERAEEIASVEGLDCLFMGPADLSLSLGVERGSPEHEAAIERILEAAQSAGIPAGIPCGSVEDALRRAEQGFKLIHCGSEFGMIRSGISVVLEALGRGS